MKLKHNHYYRARNGKTFGPIADTEDGTNYPFESPCGHSWTPEGFEYEGEEHPRDLIEEVPNPNADPRDEQLAHQAAEIDALKTRIKQDALNYLAENDTLRARVEELEAEAAKGTFHAGNFSLLQQRDRLRMERDELRTRVEELEARLAEAVKWRDEYKSEWDRSELRLRACESQNEELSTRLTESERLRDLQFEVSDKHSDLLEARLAEAHEKLAALQPKENAMTHYIVSKEFLDACTTPMDMWEDDRGPWELSDEEYQAAVTVNERDRAEPTIVRQTWANVYDEDTKQHPSKIEANKMANVRNNRIGIFRRDTYSDGTVRCELEPINPETEK